MTELPKINISNPLDELFSTEEERQSSQQERIVTINCDEIDSFQKHPFKVRDNQDMDELIESIQKNGVIMPCIVRPKENGRYEMVSGHRRKHAAIRAGLDSLPCIVRDLDDIQATILMVDSNAHRPYILPSEKAYSYRMKLEAMKRQAGRPNIENGVPVGHNSFVGKSREILAAESQDSNTQIQRYVRLTYLIPELLQMVDNSVEKPIETEALSMAMRPAVELSYLTPENQKIVLDFMQDTLSTPSHAQAIQLRAMQSKGILNPQGIYDLLAQEKPNQKLSSKIPINRFSRYFPPNTSAEDIEKGIFKALDFYQKAKERKASFKKSEKETLY